LKINSRKKKQMQNPGKQQKAVKLGDCGRQKSCRAGEKFGYNSGSPVLEKWGKNHTPEGGGLRLGGK